MKKKGINLAEKNGNWAGDRKITLAKLHVWVRNRMPQPPKCSTCGCHKNIDLANITNIYNRELVNWKWLCRRCHMDEDGRSICLKERHSERRLKDIDCLVCNKRVHPKRSSAKFCSKRCYGDYKINKPKNVRISK